MPNYVLIKSYFVISHLNPRTFKLLLRNDRGFDISSLRPVIWQQRAPDRKAEARNLHNLLCYAWFPHVHVEMTCLWPSRVYCMKFWITTSPAIVIGPWAHWSLLKYFSQSGVVFVFKSLLRPETIFNGIIAYLKIVPMYATFICKNDHSFCPGIIKLTLMCLSMY